MGELVRPHLILELLPTLVDLPAALGWQTTTAVVLFALLVGGTRPRPDDHRPGSRPRPRRRPETSGAVLCLATVLVLVLLAA